MRNVDIKTDVKKRVVADVALKTIVVLLTAGMCFVCYKIVGLSSEEPFLLWTYRILFVLFLLWGIGDAVAYNPAIVKSTAYHPDRAKFENAFGQKPIMDVLKRYCSMSKIGRLKKAIKSLLKRQ